MRPRGEKADSWGAFQLRYISYRKKPTWNTWLYAPDGRGQLALVAIEHMREKGRRAIERLNKALHRLRNDPDFPKRPSLFSQRDLSRIVRLRLLPKRQLLTLCEAIIFTRDRYTCQYCGRSVAGVWRESGKQHTIGLVSDHCRPKVHGGTLFSLMNTKTACWSCNGIKSSLPTRAFQQELISLARAVAATDRREGRLKSISTR